MVGTGPEAQYRVEAKAEAGKLTADDARDLGKIKNLFEIQTDQDVSMKAALQEPDQSKRQEAAKNLGFTTPEDLKDFEDLVMAYNSIRSKIKFVAVATMEQETRAITKEEIRLEKEKMRAEKDAKRAIEKAETIKKLKEKYK